MIQALLNCTIFTGETQLHNHALILDGERIREIVSDNKLPADVAQTRDLDGGTLLPGFIDLQLNGGGGALFNDKPSINAIRRIGAAHRRYGTTGFLPTLISTSAQTMQLAIDSVREAIAEGVPGVLGIHLEGPYLNPLRKGIHDDSEFSQLDQHALELVSANCGGKTLVTVAPEQVAAESISQLVAKGVVVCAGHSAASYLQVRHALQAGMSGFTHLFNAMSPLTSREPGVVGAALEDRDSYCGIIVDGYHVHPATLKVALAAKHYGHLYLVTDAMPCVGTNERSFELQGQHIELKDGRCTSADGTLAGSNLDMITAVRNCIDMLHLDWQEAVRMASTYPAAHLGVDDELGYISPGYRANLVLVDTEFNVCETWIDGRGLASNTD